MRSLTVLPNPPKTRGECASLPRPCPASACRYHITPKFATEHQPASRLRPVKLVDESCVLDVADKGPQSLDEIGALLGCTYERVRQLEEGAMATLRKYSPKRLAPAELAEMANDFVHATTSDDEEEPFAWFDQDFCRAVSVAYLRIVPEAERLKFCRRRTP